MRLKDFIEQTFKDLFDGITAAQEYALTKNAKIAGCPNTTTTKDGVKIFTELPRTTEIEFEIQLGKTSSKADDLGVGVVLSLISVGAKRKTSSKDTLSNRISFKVPFTFPIQESEKQRSLKC